MPLTESNITHHIKAIRPALSVMNELGFSDAQCLEGTGIDAADLEQQHQGITLDQELAFHKRMLRLSKNPTLGLILGEAYRVESYGVLGYAMLSAATLADALKLASDFHILTFTHFDIQLRTSNDTARLILKKRKLFESELLQLYEDRELSAAISGGSQAVGLKLVPRKICIMHSGAGSRPLYERYFDCDVEFDCEQTELWFDASLLNTPMPLRDPETSGYCKEQCQRLLSKLSKQSSLVDEVRRLLISQPGNFPSIEVIAAQLNSSTRTVRRRLKQENSSYQEVVNEIRYALAKEYLNSKLSLEHIAELLDYSDASNFSHAFKRWYGHSPRHYRAKLSRQDNAYP